jgi:hypothetical protein
MKAEVIHQTQPAKTKRNDYFPVPDGSRASAVGIARSSSPGKVKNFLVSTSSRQVLRPTLPPIQRVPGALSRGVKQPRREADHSSPTTAEVKKMWIYTSTPKYAFMA